MTKEEWKSLTKKQQWDCIVALRGPDIKGSEVIKCFTTGVIRQQMSSLMRVGGQLSNLGFVVVPNDHVFVTKTSTTTLRPDLDHFVTHTYEAAEILGIPIVWVVPDVWEKMVLAQNDHKAKIIFLNYVKNNPGSVTNTINKKYIEPLLTAFSSYLDGDSDEG